MRRRHAFASRLAGSSSSIEASADPVEGDAQPFGRDAEREQRIELGEARSQLFVAGAEDEQDGIRCRYRFPVDAAGGACLIAFGEDEAQVSYGERVDGGEGTQRACRRTGQGELVERLLRVRRSDEDRRPAFADRQPAFEEFASGAPEVEALIRVTDAGLRLEEVPVDMAARAQGESRLRGAKAAKLILTVAGVLFGAAVVRARRR